jgi:uncharacterized damage-inducible protein DinB
MLAAHATSYASSLLAGTERDSMTELEVLLENWSRFRSVTLQFLDLLEEDDLNWRPEPDAFSCGQQLLHIAQTEAYCIGGLFGGEWDTGMLKFPEAMPSIEELRRYFTEVRGTASERLESLTEVDLATPHSGPNDSASYPLRWWLWFVLEHEIHHKAQLAVYVRQIGKVAPFFANPLPLGERPDIQAREDLDGA